MNDAFWAAAILDGVLYFGSTAALSLSSREFGLYNLSAGLWLVLGGWLVVAANAVSGDSYPAPINAGFLWAFLLLAVVQVVLPFVLRKNIQRHPRNYLFVSLGIALIANNIGPTWLLTTSGATIPIQRRGLNDWLLAAVALSAVLAVRSIFRSKWWAHLVLSFRVVAPGLRISLGISCLILAEIILLLALGASGFYIHKGVFGSGEYRTIVPILALVAFRSKPLKASLFSFVAVILGHAFVAIAPGIGPGLTQYAKILSILILLVVVYARESPKAPLRLAQVVKPVVVRLQCGWHDSQFRGLVLGGVVFLVLALSSSILAQRFPRVLGVEDVHKALGMCVLASVCWFALRFLGVATLAWPAVGVLALYILQSGVWVVVFLPICLLWVVHFWFLRVLPHEAALVTDLALVVCLHQWIKSSAVISGADEVVIFNLSLLQWVTPFWVFTIQIVLMAMIIGGVLAAGFLPRLRAWMLGLANFRVAASHGLPVKSLFSTALLILVIISIVSMTAFHVISSPITAHELSVESGIIVFMIGNVMLLWGAATGFSFIFVLYAFLPIFFLEYGALFDAVIGLALLCVVMLPRRSAV
jgi:hypothetical protein